MLKSLLDSLLKPFAWAISINTEMVFVFLYIAALVFLFRKSRKFVSIIIATMSLRCLVVVSWIADVFLDDDFPYEIYVYTFKNDHYFGFWQFHFGHLVIPISLILYVLMFIRVNVTFRSRVRSETS